LNTSNAGLPERPTNEAAIPTKLKALIVVLTAIAILIICWSGWDLTHQTRSTSWILFTLLAVITVPITVSLPTAATVVSLGDTYIMAVAMMHGTSACVVATACYALATLLPLAKRLRFRAIVFNFSGMVCGAFLYSTAYHLAEPADANGITATMLPAAILALTSFAFSSLLTATAVSWKSGKGSLRYWTRVHLPLVVNFLIAAACAIFIAAWFEKKPFILLAVAPAIGLTWVWTKVYKTRLSRVTTA
jgi:hypothetical protein